MESFYPPAVRRPDGRSGGSWVGDADTRKLVLHTTETNGVPDYSDGRSAPHLTCHWNGARTVWVQHTPFTSAARALRNEPGGVQTNREDRTFQLEIVARSNRPDVARHGGLWVGALPTQYVADITGFIIWANTALGVPLRWPERQATSYAAANAPGFRMTDTEWDVWSGVCGHQHVPENTHWDPGAFPWQSVFTNLEPQEEAVAVPTWAQPAVAKAAEIGMSNPEYAENPIRRFELFVIFERMGLLEALKHTHPGQTVQIDVTEFAREVASVLTLEVKE